MPDDREPAAQIVDEVSLVDVRCSAVVARDDAVLLLRRDASGDWVLPGGRPRPGESIADCACREMSEETGLAIITTRCALVLEVMDPHKRTRVVELIFLGELTGDSDRLGSGEPGATPCWVPLADIRTLTLRPPIAGRLNDIAHGDVPSVPCVSNLWRPDESWTSELWEQAE